MTKLVPILTRTGDTVMVPEAALDNPYVASLRAPEPVAAETPKAKSKTIQD